MQILVDKIRDPSNLWRGQSNPWIFSNSPKKCEIFESLCLVEELVFVTCTSAREHIY
ncbi:PMEI domain-containing protein [Psidium guajava]|nr:PMEI domain-containing protein [Psidium guajava]